MSSVLPDEPLTRVGFIVSSLHGGGAEAVGRSWMTWFASRGYAVNAILVSDTPTSDLLRADIAIHREPSTGSHLSKVRALRKVIARERIDVLVSLQTYPNLIAIAAAAKNPKVTVVVTEHNLISLGLPGSSLSHRVKIALAKRWYRRADVVTSASHPVAAEMTAAFSVPASRSLVVPNPAAAKAENPKRVQRVPGTERGLQLVLACRLVPQKSPHLAIDTASELKSRGIATEVVSFGGGPLEERLRARARAAGVQFTAHGWVENWFDHFADNSVVLLPSHREGLGNVLVEAAAHGVPSVAVSTALGVADAVVPGVTGVLALDSDPSSIADAVVQASALDVDGVEPWIERFSEASSGGLLEAAVDYAKTRATA